MRKYYVRVSILMGVILILVVFFFMQTRELFPDSQTVNFQERKHQTITIELNKAVFSVVVVKERDDLVRGLSGTDSLGSHEGMWFDFGSENRWGIWMKDMKFPIDILWVDRNFDIVTIAERVGPETYPEIFYPDREIPFVLELAAGSVENYHLKVGDTVLMP